MPSAKYLNNVLVSILSRMNWVTATRMAAVQSTGRIRDEIMYEGSSACVP